VKVKSVQSTPRRKLENIITTFLELLLQVYIIGVPSGFEILVALNEAGEADEEKTKNASSVRTGRYRILAR
jgi:hypothetical protein